MNLFYYDEFNFIMIMIYHGTKDDYRRLEILSGILRRDLHLIVMLLLCLHFLKDSFALNWERSQKI